MPYHVKAAVNHMHYCSSAYINYYEIFLREKCSRASREPLCPLFKWNKLVILRAWWIICNKSLGDFLLHVHRDCVFPKPPHTQGAEISAAVWDLSVCRNQAGGALGEPSKSGTDVAVPVQCWALVATWFGMQDHVSSWLCTLQHWPACLRLMWQRLTPLFCTGIQSCSRTGFLCPFSFCLFERGKQRVSCEFLGAYGSKYYSDNQQRNMIYGQKLSLLLGWLI